MKRIAIIDVGIGNLRSVQKAFEHVGAMPTITDDPAVVTQADAAVLPGVGAFGDDMDGLRSRGLDAAVLDVISVRNRVIIATTASTTKAWLPSRKAIC